MMDERDRLQELAQRIMATDPGVLNRAKAIRTSGNLTPHVEAVREKLAGALERAGGAPDEQLALETIVVRTGRPVLLVENDDYKLEGPESDLWKDRLNQPTIRSGLKHTLPVVGRVEVENHPSVTWLGTCWVVDDDLLMTNRHVAEEFAARSEGRFVFRHGVAGSRMKADVDFKEGLNSPDPRRFRVLDIAYIEADDGPDMALLRVQTRSDAGLDLTAKLKLSAKAAAEKQFVATVGYPAADSRVPDQDLVRRLFGDVYNVKRLAPGQLLKPRDGVVLHDCSTLGGNSGSPIVDLASGEVVGLHFSGLFLQENHGVPAPQLAQILNKVKRRTTISVPDRPPGPKKQKEPSVQTVSSGSGTHTIHLVLNVPIEVSVKVGTPRVLDSSGQPGPNGGREATIGEAVDEARAQLRSFANVLLVRDGFVFRNSWITDEPAVVVVLKDREAAGADTGIPKEIRGFPVEIRGHRIISSNFVSSTGSSVRWCNSIGGRCHA